jgi:structure-specific recognition protein 1
MAGTGLGWKGDFEAKANTIGAADLKWMQWIRVARGFQLRIGLKGEKRRVAYEGFEREDHERLKNAVNNYYNITLEEKETSVRGWNWGYADIQGDDLAFLIGGKPAFSVPLNTVHNTSINKAEVALELRDENMLSQIKKLEADRDNKEARRMKKAAPDEMVEIRFFIPGTVGESRRRGKQAKKAAVEGDSSTKAKKETNDDDEMKPVRDADASGSEAEDEEDEDQAAAETFFETIKEKAEIGQVQGATLVSFPDILCTTPRCVDNSLLLLGILVLTRLS